MTSRQGFGTISLNIHPVQSVRRSCLFLAVLLIASCEHAPVDGTGATRKKFAAVYADLLKSNIRLKNMGVDSTEAIRDADSVLVRHGITREEYRAMIHTFGADPGQWKAFLEEVNLALSEDQGRVTTAPPHP